MKRKIMLSIMLWLILALIIATFPLNVAVAQDPSFFNVTIIAPGNANLLRRQWGQMFASSLQEIGINASVVFLGWSEVFDRVLTPPFDRIGKTYDEGGFDILLVGWTPMLIPEPRQNYYGSPEFFAPEGPNYYLWNNTQSNQLLDKFITSIDVAERSQTLQAWQSVYFSEIPASQIFYTSAPALITPELSGYDWIYFKKQCNPEFLKGKTSVVYASEGEIESLIPSMSYSWFDTTVISPIFNGLAQVNNAKQVIPALLTSWVPSENGFKWTFTCRSGVTWHDGADFTADDIIYSLWALMNPDTGSQFVGDYRSVFGNKVKFTWKDGTSTTLGTGTRAGNITAVDSTTVEVWLPELADGRPHGYFDPYLLTLANNVIPKHIFEKIPVWQWVSSPFNTGLGSIVIDGTTYTGPIGTGPYKWVEFNPTAQLVHLRKFNDYWNRTALEADGLFGVTDYYIRFIYAKAAALGALKNDEVDMLDANYQMQTEVIEGAIDPSWATILNLEDVGRQEIGYNMRHPIFGTGTETPLGKADPTRAAEAARYVRTAFDYAIQRQQIVDNLMLGFGRPAATPITPTQPYFNASITPRLYDLSKAQECIEKAGYTSAPKTISELKATIEELSLEGQIEKGVANSLTAKLDAAQKLIVIEQIDKAKIILDRFISQVQRLSGIRITPEAADLLVKSAQYIMSQL